ncbi:MAG: ribosome biogenesis GTPase Der, partial [Bacteroidia bacterium]|nr:ribosome biogenesis GTPase Der [Bacteroidia bacterium]
WNGVEFSVIDTGGYIMGSEVVFEAEIRRQVKIAVEECNFILFVVDITEGVTTYDKEVADLIRKSNRKVILIANKSDNNERAVYAAEFYKLGLGEVFAISAINGAGTGELLDELVKQLPDETGLPEEENIPRIAIIGRPNVGKSSLTNALLGEERNIVTEVAGTTRDSINTRYKAFGHDLILIDTAGIRKKAKVQEDLEFYSVMRSIKALENCDICVLLLDASQGIEHQDLSIFHLAARNYKGIVIAVNKWDLEEDKKANYAKEYEDFIRQQIEPFRDVPIVFISAKDKQRILKVIELAMVVYENKKRHIPTSELNDFFLPLIEGHAPPAIKGKNIKVKYVMQIKGQPTFLFFCNLPQYMSDSYKRFLENKLREKWNFEGVPIQIYCRKK